MHLSKILSFVYAIAKINPKGYIHQLSKVFLSCRENRAGGRMGGKRAFSFTQIRV